MRHRQQQGYIFMLVVVTLFLTAAIALMLSRHSSVAVHLVRSTQEQEAAAFAAEAGLQHARWLANSSNCDNYTNIPTTVLDGASQLGYSATFTGTTLSPVVVTATGTAGASASVETRRPVTVYAPPTTTPITPLQDTYIKSGFPTSNYGTSKKFKISQGTDEERGLISFRVEQYAATTNIAKAVLQLYSYGGFASGPMQIAVYPVTTEWDGTAATWNTARAGVAWAAPGGDSETQAAAIATVSPSGWGPVEWDITALVQRWVGGADNFGLMFRVLDNNASIQFGSSEEAWVNERPVLKLTSRCECGRFCLNTGSCSADYIPGAVDFTVNTGKLGYKHPEGVAFAPEGEVIDGVTLPSGGASLTVAQSNLLLFDKVGSLLHTSAPRGISDPKGVAWLGGGTWNKHILVADTGANRLRLYLANDLSLVGSLRIPSDFTEVTGLSYIGTTASGDYADTVLATGRKSVLLFGDSPRVVIYRQGDLNRQATINLPLGVGIPSGIAHIPFTDSFLLLDTDNQRVLKLNFDGQLEGSYNTPEVADSKVGAGLAIDTESCQHLYVDNGDATLMSLYPSPPCTTPYEDDFESNSYAGSLGDNDWSPNPWTENGDDDNAATGGVSLRNTDSGIWLSISGPDKGAKRAMEGLSDFSHVSLSFDVRKLSLDDAADYVKVEFNGGNDAGWVLLTELAGPAEDETSSEFFDISAHLGGLSPQLRLRSSAGMGVDDTVLIDNVRFQTCN